MASKKKATPKVVEPKVETLDLHVLYSQNTSGGGSTSDDPYSTREDEHTSTTFKGAVIGDSSYLYGWQSETFEVPKEAFAPMRPHVYAVVGYYSDGDSFHHSYGNMHIVDVYGNIDKAHAVARAIEAESRLGKNESIFGHRRYPWGGYFSSLERVEVEVLSIIGVDVIGADPTDTTRDPNDIPSW